MAARLQIDVINPAFAWAESFLFLPLERSARTMLVLVRIKGRNGKKGKKSKETAPVIPVAMAAVDIPFSFWGMGRT